jgi:hypothetical protein
MSDLFIEQNIVGGLNSKLIHGFKHVEIIFFSSSYDLGPLGQMLDSMMGGNPNPTYGQMFGASRGMGGYSYHYGGW